MASTSLAKYKGMIERYKASTARAREKAGEAMETALDAGLVSGAAFAFGIWEGKVNDPEHFELVGVPVPLIAGIAGHAFALLGVGKGMEQHFRSVANGALASHLNGVGRRVGAEWDTKAKDAKAKAALPGSAPAAPAAPAALKGAAGQPQGGMGVSEAELIRAAGGNV